LSRASIATR